MTVDATLQAPLADAAPDAAAAETQPSPEKSTGGFVHLHVHTEFSKQDGLARLKDAAKAAAADGQPALASTDHGNQAAAWKFAKACKSAGIKPIHGVEAYMALTPDEDWEPVNAADAAAKAAGVPLAMRPGVRFQKVTRMGMDAESGKEKRNTNNHLTLLARDEAGWRNLCSVMNKAEDSYYYKALIDYALLKEHGEGLIILTGCLGGPVASHVASARRELRMVNDDDFRRRVAAEAARSAARVTARAEQVAIAKKAKQNPASEKVAAEIARAVEEAAEAAAVAAAAAVVSATEEEIADGQARSEAEMATARRNLGYLIECVGAENVYVEIMEHGLEAEGKEHIKTLAGLAEEFGVRVVATNDSHYVHDHECDAHDAWLLNGQQQPGKDPIRLSDPDRWRFNGEGYWMRTEAEMRAIFPNAATWQQACDETVRLAERIEDDVIPTKKLRLPKFPVPADVVAAWEAGDECTVTDSKGNEHPARRPAGKSRGYRTPAAYYLHTLVLDGAKARYGTLTPEVKERLAFEFHVITVDLGLEDYFLIVRDVIDWCRSDRAMPTPEHPLGAPALYDDMGKRIPNTGKKPILVGPGRGSAAGSAVSYCIGIVQVDPLRWGLLFERFLDIDRVGMPDIDVDFESARRGEVYDYLAARYDVIHPDGRRDRYVARIGAFQIAKTKRAIKDAARVLEDTAKGDALNKLVPVHQGKPQSFAALFEEPIDKDGVADPNGKIVQNPEAIEFRDLAVQPGYREIVALARAFEDVVAGEGIHAAGVIISDEPLDDLIPMRLLREKGEVASAVPIALWDGKDIDSFGMLKLDALSIDNLDFLSAAVEHIARTHDGLIIDPDDLPDPDDLSDPRVAKTYELLRAGGTEGVFQMESQGLTELTVSAAPTQFEDISALLALYRPGPMGAGYHTMFADRKTGRSPVDYGIFTDDADEAAVIESVLGDTQGLVVYQEQMMILAGKVAGFGALERSDLRKAISKKVPTEIERLGVIFMKQGAEEMTLEDGSHKIAFKKSTLENLWVAFEKSAAYAFNKSHTVAYGYLSYVTAYFSANYPVEYAAGVLGVSKKKADKRLATIASLRRKGIEVLPPDVNRSVADTAPDLADPTAIRLGLTEIRDVGANGDHIVAEREAHGEFGSLRDVMARVKATDKDGKPIKLPVTAVEGLIEAGAFDTLGLPRLGLMLIARAVTPEFEPPVPDAEWSPLERSARQRQRLGVALGAHPMAAYADTLRGYIFNTREDRFGNEYGGRPAALHVIEGIARGNVLTWGVLTSWSERNTRKGTKLASFTLEGMKATMTGTVFNDAISAMRKSGNTPQIGDIVALAGSVKTRTVTSMVTDQETGEEVEETQNIRELIGSFMEVVPVDTRPEFDLPEVPDDRRVDLTNVISMARFRAEKAAAAKKDAATAARKTKTTKSATAADTQDAPGTTAAGEPAYQEPLFHSEVGLSDFTDDDLAATPAYAALGFVEPASNSADPLPVKSALDADRPWAGALFATNGIGLWPDSPLLDSGIDVRTLRAEFDLGDTNATPSALARSEDAVFCIAGGCRCACTRCRRSAARACVHHGGDQPCTCIKGCATYETRRGEYLLVIVTSTIEKARAAYGSIVMTNDAWAECDDFDAWRFAPLDAFTGEARSSAAPSAAPSAADLDDSDDSAPLADVIELGQRAA